MKQAHNNSEEFIQRLIEGDEAAFSGLYEQYAKPIYRYIYFRISSEEHAEDMMQEVFVKFVDVAMRLKKKPQNVNAYLYSIARNLVTDHYRDNAKRDEVEISTVENNEHLQVSGREDDHVEVGFLTEAIKELKPVWQEIVILKHVEGMTHEEIAQALGKSSTYIRVNLHRALAELRKKLDATQ